MLLTIILSIVTTMIGFIAGYKTRGMIVERHSDAEDTDIDFIDERLFDAFLEYLDQKYRMSGFDIMNNFNWRCGILQAMIPENHPEFANVQYYSSCLMVPFCDDIRKHLKEVTKLYRMGGPDRLIESWFIKYTRRSQSRVIQTDGYKFKLRY